MIFNQHIEKISDLILNYYANSKLSTKEIQIQVTRKEFEGDWTVIVFPLLRFSKKNIEETADELGRYLTTNLDYISSFNIIKGFINLVFSDEFWFNVLKFSFSKDFEINESTNKTIVIESSSPNTNKPLHLGHLRTILLGHSIANILEADGNIVKRVQIINDRGIHICKSMIAWLKFANGENPNSENIKGDYFVGKYYILFETKYQEEQQQLITQGYSLEDAKLESQLLKEAKEMLIKWENGEVETRKLWKKMNSWVYDGFEETYKKLGISFDKNYYESDTYLKGKECVLKGIKDGVFKTKSDSSAWVDLVDDNLDEKILLRSDGTSVYMTQDLGTAILRYKDFSFNQMIYVVGNEQNYHFDVLFKVLGKMGFNWSNNLFHLSYGMVDLPSGKMKSREGTVVDVDDILNEMHSKSKKIILQSNRVDDDSINKLSVVIGDAALKYFILKTDAKKNILFNPEESIDFNGHTGPFIQYTYARINSILKKTDKFSQTFKRNHPLIKEEIALIKLIWTYPLIIAQSAQNLNPSLLANYIYSLAKEYNHFYQQISILNLDDKNDINFRVTISKKVSVIILNGMNLLGISVPYKM